MEKVLNLMEEIRDGNTCYTHECLLLFVSSKVIPGIKVRSDVKEAEKGMEVPHYMTLGMVGRGAHSDGEAMVTYYGESWMVPILSLNIQRIASLEKENE